MDNAIRYISPSDLIQGEFHNHLESTNINNENLINSIKNYGILEPLIVRAKGDKYEIILGNRRYKAALELGLEKVPVIILNLDDSKALEFIIADKVQKKELSSKEEAYLYDKALSYPNTNKEKLSMNLGIPLNRITSKLNLLKKSKIENNKELSQQPIITNYDNQNNSVNNDIINLSELNKKEEREDYNMNNNQFISNDNTQNLNQQGQMPQQQEPTFGGRFFPSLEDEPTNMNLNGNIGIIPTPQPQQEINTQAPLIDLTDLSIDNQQNNINPMSTPDINPMNTQQGDNSMSVQNQFNAGIEINPQQPIDINSAMTPVPPIEQPLDIGNLTQSNSPIIENNFGIDSSFTSQPQEPITINQPQIQDMNLIKEQPIPMMDPTINQGPINIDNIPNLSIPPMDNQPAPPIDINQPIETPNSKDVLPVVNMIKNMAISLEAFGYKLNITESDSVQTYNITIEVEK